MMRSSTLFALILVAIGLYAGVIRYSPETRGLFQNLAATADRQHSDRGVVSPEDYPHPSDLAAAPRGGPAELHFITESSVEIGSTVTRTDVSSYCLVLPVQNREACYTLDVTYNRSACLADLGHARDIERTIVAYMGDFGYRRTPSQGRLVTYAIGADQVLRVVGCERQPLPAIVDWIPLTYDKYGFFTASFIMVGAAIGGFIALIIGLMALSLVWIILSAVFKGLIGRA